MSERHPIDELFGQGLANAEAPVPDGMFERIAQARQQRRRKRILGWTALGGGLSVGALLLAWWMMSSPDLGAFPVEPTGLASPTMVASAATDATNVNGNTAAINGVARAETTATASTSTNLATRANVSQGSTNNTNTTTAAATTHTVSTNTSVASSTVANEEPTASAATATNSNLPPADLRTETDLASETTNTTAVKTTSEEEGEPARVFGPHQRASLGAVSLLPSKAFGLAERKDVKLFANHAPRCADFAGPFFRFDAEVLAGPAYAQQILAAKSNTDNEHLQQRINSESARISATTSVRLAAMSNTGLGFRVGASYTKVNDLFTNQVGSRMVVDYIIDPSGVVIGSDTTHFEGYEETFKNELKFLEVPLLVSYETRVGKLRVGVNAGAHINVLFDAKGTILSPANGEPIAFGQVGDRNKIPIFDRRATAAWYGGLSVAYNLHSRYSLLAEPYFKTFPRALSSQGYELSQNYWMTGIQLGLRMRL